MTAGAGQWDLWVDKESQKFKAQLLLSSLHALLLSAWIQSAKHSDLLSLLNVLTFRYFKLLGKALPELISAFIFLHQSSKDELRQF